MNKKVFLLFVSLSLLSLANCNDGKDFFVDIVGKVNEAKASGLFEKVEKTIQQVTDDAGLGNLRDDLLKKAERFSKNDDVKAAFNSIEDKLQGKMSTFTGNDMEKFGERKESLISLLKEIESEINVLGLKGFMQEKASEARDELLVWKKSLDGGKLREAFASFSDNLQSRVEEEAKRRGLTPENIANLKQKVVDKVDKLISKVEAMPVEEKLKHLPELVSQLRATVHKNLNAEVFVSALTAMERTFLVNLSKLTVTLETKMTPELRTRFQSITHSLKSAEAEISSKVHKWKSAATSVEGKLNQKFDKIENLVKDFVASQSQWKDKLSAKFQALRKDLAKLESVTADDLKAQLKEAIGHLDVLEGNLVTIVKNVLSLLSGESLVATLSHQIDAAASTLSNAPADVAEKYFDHMATVLEQASYYIGKNELEVLRAKLALLKMSLKTGAPQGKNVEVQSKSEGAHGSWLLAGLVAGAFVVMAAVMAVIFTVVKKGRVYVPLDKQGDNVIDA